MVSNDILQKVFYTIVIGLLSWVVLTTKNLEIGQAVLSSKFESIQDIAIDRYTKTEADAAFLAINDRINKIEGTINAR
jgi:hypothetical protein